MMKQSETIHPDKQDWDLAKRIHAEFKAKPESQHIAMEHALAHLSASIRLLRPETVLELGAGIGTITKLLLDVPGGPKRIIATEDHPICLTALKNNLTEQERSRITVITSLEDLLKLDMKFDFAICDGGFGDKRQFRGIGEGAFCFFEGARGPHRRILNEALGERGLTFAARNYPRIGWRLFLKRPRDPEKGGWAKPKIKRRRGCWCGPVVAKTSIGPA